MKNHTSLHLLLPCATGSLLPPVPLIQCPLYSSASCTTYTINSRPPYTSTQTASHPLYNSTARLPDISIAPNVALLHEAHLPWNDN
ncbi:hypothetical protein V8C44DRAFT_316767 [Trichoderma aethiopicum]